MFDHGHRRPDWVQQRCDFVHLGLVGGMGQFIAANTGFNPRSILFRGDRHCSPGESSAFRAQFLAPLLPYSEAAKEYRTENLVARMEGSASVLFTMTYLLRCCPCTPQYQSTV